MSPVLLPELILHSNIFLFKNSTYHPYFFEHPSEKWTSMYLDTIIADFRNEASVCFAVSSSHAVELVVYGCVVVLLMWLSRKR